MKTIYTIIFSVIIFSIVSCSKSVDAPVVSLTASKTSVAVGEQVHFTVQGDADGLSIYTGDAGHEFENSKYILTRGKDITTEKVFLTQTKFDELKASGLVAKDSILNLIQAMIGKNYEGRSVVDELVKEFYSYEINDGDLAAITNYFTVEGASTPPTGNYATGVGIDPESDNKVYSYTYRQPGTYTVTLFATSIGRKKYSGNGYQDTRVTYEAEYDRTVALVTITITVS